MKSDINYLEHIYAAIESIEKYLKTVTGYIDFVDNDMLIDALIRKLEIIGEATNNLSDKFKRDNPEISFADIIAMRNFLIHEYFGVNKKVVWESCTKDIPKLKKQIKPFLE